MENRELINILTRTSKRPKAFKNCYLSVRLQKHSNYRHIVSYENDEDLSYLENLNIDKVKVKKDLSKKNTQSEFIFAPYNLFCNTLLNEVQEGWILILDDDNNLLHNKVLKEINKEIVKYNEDTIFFWKTRYPNGEVLPDSTTFFNKKIKINKIDTSCFLFHSKYKNVTNWDSWKGSDFRFIEQLSNRISNKIWIEKVYVQINNYGDFGKENDIEKHFNSLIFNKNLFWYALPKRHTTVFGYKVFSKEFYIKLYNKLKSW